MVRHDLNRCETVRTGQRHLRTHIEFCLIRDLDALGRARGVGPEIGGHDEKEQTLNQLFAELDGFDPSVGVVLLAATNRPDRFLMSRTALRQARVLQANRVILEETAARLLIQETLSAADLDAVRARLGNREQNVSLAQENAAMPSGAVALVRTENR